MFHPFAFSLNKLLRCWCVDTPWRSRDVIVTNLYPAYFIGTWELVQLILKAVSKTYRYLTKKNTGICLHTTWYVRYILRTTITNLSQNLIRYFWVLSFDIAQATGSHVEHDPITPSWYTGHKPGLVRQPITSEANVVGWDKAMATGSQHRFTDWATWNNCPFVSHISIITMTSLWARGRLKSSASPLFTQPFIQVQIKENINVPRHWPLSSIRFLQLYMAIFWKVRSSSHRNEYNCLKCDFNIFHNGAD